MNPLGGEAGHGHGRVWRLAWPIILSNVSASLLGAADTAVMGHLPDPAYIGAVAVGALILSYLLWIFGFLRMSTTGLTAQAFGARDMGELRAVLTRSLLLAAAIGGVLVALQSPMGRLAFTVIDPSSRVGGLSEAYFNIRIWGLPGALAIFAVTGWLIGVQRTEAALVLQLGFNGINLVLDLVFVLVLGWGVEGVAIGTVIAEYSGLAIGLWLVRGTLGGFGGHIDWAAVLDRGRLRALLGINVNVFIRSILIVSAIAYMTVVGARLGDVILAANAVLLLFQTFMGQALDGFAFAAEALVGSAIGARDRARYRNAVRVAGIWSLVVAIAFALFFATMGGLVIAALTDLPEVRAAAGEYLPWTALAPLILVWGYLLDGIFIGATRTAEMRNAMILSVLVYAGALWLLVPAWGNHGLWAAYIVLAAARALTLAPLYPRIERALTPPENRGRRGRGRR